MFSMMHVHGTGALATGFLQLAAMWLGMMALMMTPTVWPWLQTFQRFGGQSGRARRVISTLSFSSGYLVAWLLYSAAAALFHGMLLRVEILDPGRGVMPILGAGILVIAGLFQFAPLKRACLTHCRNPFSYFLARWRNGPVSGFRLGLTHGLFCLGCCWALMLTALAVGVMNVWWMAALTVAVFVEQVLPRGERIRVPLGVGLIFAGLLQVW